MKNHYALVTSISVLALTGHARADVVSEVLGCEGDPCVVSFNAGGEVGSFRAAAREIVRSGRRVVINGPCLSACAILADVARGRVCVTTKARFGFHKGYVLAQPEAGGPPRFVKRFTPSHSGDIARWVKRHGGYPSRGYKVMDGRAARKIWNSC
jgi:hypothetical protein